MNLLTVTNMSKTYGDKKVLGDVNFDINEGEIITLIGPSGSGKSTFFNLITLTEELDYGEVKFKGRDIDRKGMIYDIGYVLQENALFDSFTIEENLTIPLRENRIPDIKQKIDEILLLTGLDRGILGLYPNEISGGMQKRVAIARTVLLEPKILLLDEPSSGLDPITTRKIDRLITNLKEKKGISSIIITHNVEEIRSISDRICCFFNTEVVFFDKPTKIRREGVHPFVLEYFGLETPGQEDE